MKIFKLLLRAPNWPLLLILIIIAGIAEAIGISALVPVASSLTGDFNNGGELPFPFYYIQSALNLIGVPYTFNNLLLCTLVLMLSSFFAIFIQETTIAKSRYKLCEDLRNRSTNAIFYSTWEHLSDVSSGELANKVIHESERGSESIMALIGVIAGLVQIGIYILFCVLLSWKLSLVALATILLAAASSKYLVRRVGSLGTLSADLNTFYSKNLVDFMRGSKLIKATNLTREAGIKLSEINNKSSKTSTEILINQSRMKLQLQGIIGSAMVLILFIAVAILNLSVSVLLIFLYIIIRLAPKFTNVQGLYFSYFAHLPSLNLVDEVISKANANKEKRANQTRNFKEIEKSIVFSGVSYRYPSGDTDVLKNISLEISKNQFVAIVGKTGCGKSTLLDLIMGLINPSVGDVKIDETRVCEYEIESYRKTIGFVPQEPSFFDGTIRENLCFGVEAKDEHILNSLSVAQIKDFVKSLELGIDTPIGEAGTRLSGGQKQRLAIARALVRSPSILILDEATSAMDSQSEKNFQKTLEEISKQYTLVVVAHRLSTIKKAENIFVLEEGTLVQQGNFEDLNSKPGVFSNLVSVQYDLK